MSHELADVSDYLALLRHFNHWRIFYTRNLNKIIFSSKKSAVSTIVRISCPSLSLDEESSHVSIPCDFHGQSCQI